MKKNEQIMCKVILNSMFWILLLFTSIVKGQETRGIGELTSAKEQIVAQERAALKKAVEAINDKIANQRISKEEAQREKEAIAKKHAANIQNRIIILENKYALLKRNSGDTLSNIEKYENDYMEAKPDNEDSNLFGIKIRNGKKEKGYNRRTSYGPVLAVGFNQALIEGESLDDSPYRFGGSRFFELGWNWRTKIFKNSHLIKITYGATFQFNGLKPTNNRIFVNEGGQTILEEFPLELQKSKFRMDNLVIPIHLEFGHPRTNTKENPEDLYRTNRFRFGIGGFAGFNFSTRQKLKYTNVEGERVKEKIKRDYNRSGVIYGLSSYIGFGDTALYLKYDLSPIFKNALIAQRNISLGVRFDL